MNFQEIVFLVQKLESYKEKLNKGELSKEDIEMIGKLEKMLDGYVKNSMSLKYQFGSIRNYQELLDNGFTLEQIKKFQDEDQKYVKECESKLKDNIEKREHMFGYPANMKKDSSVSEYLRYLESQAYLMNGCGDPYEQGNYKMDNKDNEIKIVDAIKNNIGLDDYWGYITTGGTEGNIWGINYGLNKYKDAILYYSSGTHYSISKANIGDHETVKISSTDDKVNTQELLKEIEINYLKTKKPVVLILNFGTTKMGAVDSIYIIKNYLVNHNIPHYIHVDAALYGGIGKNQKDSPYMNFKNLDVDSISISLHKYIGLQECKGVVLAKKENIDKYIDYIGQNDTTLCGSRDFPAFSTYQKVNEAMNRQKDDAYIDNINYFIGLLNNYGISYWRGDDSGNTFIIEKPSDNICEYYQLATFSNENGEFAHVIIFSYQDKKVIRELVQSLYIDKENKEKINEEKEKNYVKIPTNKLPKSK